MLNYFFSPLGHILFRPTLRRNNSFTNISKYPKLIHIDNLPQTLKDCTLHRKTERQKDSQTCKAAWGCDVKPMLRRILDDPSCGSTLSCQSRHQLEWRCNASPFLFFFVWCQMLKTIASPSERCGDLFKTLVFSSKNLGDL